MGKAHAGRSPMHVSGTDYAAFDEDAGHTGAAPLPKENPDEDTNLNVLIAQTHAGNEEAARLLLNQLHPLVLKLVRAYRSRRTAEEDLCQIVFLQIFRNLKQFSGKVPLEHWVSRITINTCLKQIASERVRPELRFADLTEDQARLVAWLASSTSEPPQCERNAACELVDYLMSQLAPKEKLIIKMMHIEERTLDEIKALTGWSSALIRVRAFRARQKLRRLYLKLKTTEF